MNVVVNGEQRRVEPGTTLLSVLDLQPGQTTARGVAVAVDDSVVPRAELGATVLHEGARVEVVTAVQGG